MIRMFCAALLVLSGFASLARAADAPPMPAPTESAPPPGMPAPSESTPPTPGEAGPVMSAGELAEEAPRQRAANLSYGVGTFLRWVTVPGFMLDLFTKKNVPLSSWGTGMQFFRRKGNFDLVGSLTYQDLSPADGNWLGKGHDADIDTDYVQFDHLAQWGADVSFIWHTMFTEWFGMHYGAGIGIAYIQGIIWRTSNGLARDANGNPTPGMGACTEENAGNVDACYPVGSLPNGSGGRNLSVQSLLPGNDQAGNPHRFADGNKPSALPIVNLVIGFDFRLPQVRGWEAKIEGGFYNAFFLGGGVAYTF
jgi:hypothetical protein